MSALTDALSNALVQSLWQDAVVAIVLYAVLAALRHRTANARYVASAIAFGLMAVLPVVTALVFYPRGLPATTVFRAIVENPPAITAIRIGAGFQQTAWIAELQRWAVPLWSGGVLLFSLRPLCAGAHAVTLKRRSTPADAAVRTIVARVAGSMGVERPI